MNENAVKRKLKHYISLTKPAYCDTDNFGMDESDGTEDCYDMDKIVGKDDEGRITVTLNANYLIDKFDEERAIRWIRVFLEEVLRSTFKINSRRLRDNGADYDVQFKSTIFECKNGKLKEN